MMAKPKKNKPKEPKISSHFIMSVIMPCVTLACKDEFNATPEQLAGFSKRVDRYMGYIAEGHVSMKELEKLVQVTDNSK